MPSRQINEFSQKRKRKKIELVAKPREQHPDVGPASVIVGNLVQGNRLAAAKGRDIGGLEEDSPMGGVMLMDGGPPGVAGGGRKCHYISEILRLRAHSTSDHLLFTLLNSKGTETQTVTCSQLHKKAERIARLLVEKDRLNTGEKAISCLTNAKNLKTDHKVPCALPRRFQRRLSIRI